MTPSFTCCFPLRRWGVVWVEFPVSYLHPTHRRFSIVVEIKRVVFGFRFEIERVRFEFGVDLAKVDREKQQSLIAYLK